MSLAFEVAEEIGRPIDEVWAALTDWNNASQWMPGVDQLRAHGETAAGTQITFRARGKERPSAIARCEPGRSIVLRSVQGSVTADYAYELAPAGHDSTRVTLIAKCQSEGIFWRLFFPLLRIAMRRVDGPQLANLKMYIESR